MIQGAEQNNLKNIDVTIPNRQLTVITGVSGSGKSSLAFDTLYAEGQRRYIESLSAYARQFLERLQKPRVKEISGVRPAVSIRQKNTTRNPRSTVGTVTELYDYLRLLYARIGQIHCRSCARPVQRDTVDHVVEQIVRLPEGTRLTLVFPFELSRFDLNSFSNEALSASALVENLVRHGYHRILLNWQKPAEILQLPAQRLLSEEDLRSSKVLIDRLVVEKDLGDRLADSIETCLAEGNGVAEALVRSGKKKPEILRFSERLECQYCEISYRELEPRLFSFNNPYGACPGCQGFGNTTSIDPDLVIPDWSVSVHEGPVKPFTKPKYLSFQRQLVDFIREQGIDPDTAYGDLPETVRSQIWVGTESFAGVKGFFRYLERKKYKMHVRILISRYRGYTRCPECSGARLCQDARDVTVGGRPITWLTALPITRLQNFFSDLELSAEDRAVGLELHREISKRVDFLVKVGLDYLTLDRLTSTLSGGEMQRIHLAASLGSALIGTLYVLDEPSVGLHPRDELKLISILRNLRDLGNTVVVVEHEREMIRAADQIIDMGPGAGEQGGEIIHSGTLSSLLENPDSTTGKYLTQQLRIPTPVFRRSLNTHALTVRGARQNNLKNLTLKIPLGLLTCVTGVSGSGKSTLVEDVLYAGIKKLRGEWKGEVGACDSIEGWEYLSDILLVDQSPIGKTPRSNPVTYLKAFDHIRKAFASLREARARNFGPGHFSFNVPGGRCEICQGAGTETIEMQFLADVQLVCEECRGKRYQKKLLEVTYKGKNIAQVLELTVAEAIRFFSGHAPLLRKLRLLQEVGLGYLRLGQPATTLSGGEAQRIKLASYMARKTAGQPLFIFDEPTTGLHFDDVGKLLRAFNRLTAAGGSVLVIEHNLDVIKCADWIIDLGPEGGDEGGRILCEGTPETIAGTGSSHTGMFLKDVLEEEQP